MLCSVLPSIFLLIWSAVSIWGANASAAVDDPSPHPPEPSEDDPDYLIVGAGGSGIQMALYLEQNNYSYKILEKSDVVGSFWTHFPVFDELISVNKDVRNETLRWRYDWHSFLEAPLKMLDVTEEYFPTGNDWHRYMTLVAEKAGILPNIEFNVQVDKVSSEEGCPCVYLADGSERCAKNRIFIGTGLQEKHEPYLEAIGGIPYSKMTKKLARHKTVCILGNGNSGFEVAQNVYGVAERVIIFGRKAHRLSAVTRYTGDVRTKYLQVLENMNGKLLDDVGFFQFESQKLDNEYLDEAQKRTVEDVLRSIEFVYDFKCERLVLTTGFQSRVPNGLNADNLRFPPTEDWYRSTENPSVHYIGWLMHERDFQRGAGGFLSGYRYLIRNLFQHLHAENQGLPYPYECLTKEEAVQKAISRLQIADDLVILQDGVIVRDVVVPDADEPGAYQYFEGITYHFHKEVFEEDGAISLYFAWGDGRSAETVFDGLIRYSDTGGLMNRFLHPVVEVGGLKRDIHEDHEMTWTEMDYPEAVERAIRNAFNGDLSTFRPKKDFGYKRGEKNQTERGSLYESAKLRRPPDAFPRGLLHTISRCVYDNAHPRGLAYVRDFIKKWRPVLFDYEDDETQVSSS